MVKAGILTFHNNENSGAILQALALQELVSNYLGYKTEIVEYRTKSKENSRRNQLFITKPWKIRRRVKDRKIMEGFVDSQLKTSSKAITTDDHNHAVKWLESQNYDILITGSDEVWKVKADKVESRLFPSRPFPNLYFLDPDLSAIKTSYAASGNTTDLNKLSKKDRERFKYHLESYDLISVRDNHTGQILKECGITDVDHVPDPTLMVNFLPKDIESILSKNNIDTRKPILGAHGPNSEVFKNICQYYSNKGYQIVTPRAASYADIELKGKINPIEHYSLYRFFDMVVTSSLHSTIFSIKHGTPFATIDVHKQYENMESKTHSLLEDFSMKERYIDAIDGDASEFYTNLKTLEQEPDKNHIEKRTKELQEKGYEFLNKIKAKNEKNN